MEDDQPTYVLMHAQIVYQVDNPTALHAAAHAAATARQYDDDDTGRAEQAAELATVAADIVEAALAVADAGRVIPGDVGVDEISTTTWANPCDEDGHVTQAVPDFAALFPVCECGQSGCDSCAGFQLSPQVAAALYNAATYRADGAYDDVLTHGDDPVTNTSDWLVFADYPSSTFTQDAVWRRQAARSYDDLADDLVSGEHPIPRCIGDEMALRLSIAHARAERHDRDSAGTDPGNGVNEDWDAVHEALLADSDIGQTLNPQLDGIDNPDDNTNTILGIGDYRPSAWFNSFDHSNRRDGRRAFRR